MNFQQRLTRKITRERLEAFVKQYANDLYTLDLGCANSPYSKYFKNRLGFDISDGLGVDVVGDAHNLPFKDETFEQIFCTEVLEHLHTPELAIKEMYRVLKPDGNMILTTRFLFPIHDAPHDYYRYTKYGLQHLFRDWENVKIEAEVSTIETFAVLFQRIGFQTKLRFNFISKIVVFLTARFFQTLNGFVLKEYGNIKKSHEERTIMTSGYYLVAKKPVSKITEAAK